MEQYIPKSVVLAEIERRIKRFREKKDSVSIVKTNTYKGIFSFINTLEVKEVDLEKELDSMITPELKFHKALPSLFDVAKHFFELGMSVNNKE